MKTKFIAVLVSTCILLSGCGNENSISQEEYDSVLEENQKLKAENREISKEKREISSEMNKVKKEYAEYKEIMKEYEGLRQKEAEARAIEAERALEEQRAEKKQKAEEAAAQREQEEKTGYETGITYDQLARTPDDYTGKKIKFSGTVIQTMDGEDFVQIRFAVDSDYALILLGEYDKGIVPSRVLEGDVITIYGTSIGLFTYESTFGASVTIPAVSIEKIDQ